jgi:SAM-dependent methyltransferase
MASVSLYGLTNDAADKRSADKRSDDCATLRAALLLTAYSVTSALGRHRREQMVTRTLASIATYALTVVLVIAVLRQCRKPSWWPGRLFLWIMNLRHAGVTNWGLSHVPIDKHFTILDVGCGGGRTIHTLASMASGGKVHGIDYSQASVAAARRTNRQGIQSGRIDVQQASVSALPFPNSTFDLVTAVETHYYWPQPVADLQEILRVLKPGGRLVIIAETYRGERFDKIYTVAMKLLKARYLSVREHHDLFTAAGYTDIAIVEERHKGWLCGVARKPEALAA